MKFNMNSPLMDYITTVTQFIALNLIFIICCLPIITIGPAIAALYQVIMRETRGEHGYLIRKFFQHFKEMLLPAFFISLLLAIITFILLFNIAFWNELDTTFANVFIVLLYIMLIGVTCCFIYIFPLLARFKNSFLQTIKNAIFIALTHVKVTILLLIIHALAFSFLYFFPPSKIFMILIGFSFLAYCNSYLLQKVFQQYEATDNIDIYNETSNS